MEKILVTGTAGFIGMHLGLKLSEQGFDVVGLDNLNDYYDVNLKYARLAHQGINKKLIRDNTVVCGSKGIRFVKLDLGDNLKLINLFQTEKFDYVVNLAAQAGVRYSITNPFAYVGSNLIGFMNLLEACRQFPVKHLVFATSSSVYGLNNKIPFAEEDATDHQVSLYAATKKSNEVLAHSYSTLYDIPATGLRFFTVYGPWGRPDMALFKFVRNIIEDKPIDVYNYGDMYRDFTYVDDIVDGIASLVFKAPKAGAHVPDGNLKSGESKSMYQIYNIGASQPIKLMDFVKAIENKIGKKAIINYLPIQPGDVFKTYADTSKLQKAVQYAPKVTVEQGISEFIDWYVGYYKIVGKDIKSSL